MSTAFQERLLGIAAFSAIAALLLMLWSIFSSSPIILVASMSVGQALGTLSFALYGAVVVFDLRRRIRHRRATTGQHQAFGSKPQEAGEPKETAKPMDVERLKLKPKDKAAQPGKKAAQSDAAAKSDDGAAESDGDAKPDPESPK